MNRNLKILVTGGAGFIGSNLVDRLIKEGHEVVVLDNFSTGKREYVNKNARVYEMDVTDSEVFRVFRRENIDIVFHLAAQVDFQKSMEEPIEDGSINILGAVNIAKNCCEYGVKKLIYASTVNMYDIESGIIREDSRLNPMSYNSLSKKVSEEYIQKICDKHGLEYCILRYSNVYGVRQNDKGDGGIVKLFIDKIKNRSVPLIFGDINAKRDLIFVMDAVEAAVKAMELGNSGVYNIASGENISQQDIADMIIKRLKPNSGVLKYDLRDGEVYISNIDISKAKSELAWSPIFSISDGIEITIQYENKVN